MIKVGQKIFPYIGEPRQGGRFTAYQVQNKKLVGRNANGIPIMGNHGWLTILTEENHPLEEKSGVSFTITEITGVDITEYPKGTGRYRTTVFAKIDWGKKINRNSEHLEDDIPEEYQDL